MDLCVKEKLTQGILNDANHQNRNEVIAKCFII